MIKRIFQVVLFATALLGSLPAQAEVVYSYSGQPFTEADPPWMVGDSITGSFSTTNPLPAFLPQTDISGQVLDFSFFDGVQTRTPLNSELCRFEFATDGAGNIVNWSISIREVPTPPMGMPQRTLDIAGPGFGFPIDAVGEGPAGSGPCAPFAFSLSASVFEAGTWVSSEPPEANPTDYSYTGQPFTSADPPWMVGQRITGSASFSGPLPAFMPLTDLSLALDDFSFSDGVQTRTPANSSICRFELATDGAGNIVDWAITFRELPTPPMGEPQRTMDLTGPGFGFPLDAAGEGPAGMGPCDNFLFTLEATVFEAGSWVSSSPPEPDPTDYFYTGVPFTDADPPWMVGQQVTGSVSFAGPLPPFMPLTDLTFALDDFSFTDGVQTRTPANSSVCRFQLATDGAGNIVHWVLSFREVPTPPMGQPQRTIDSTGPGNGFPLDAVGEGPAGVGPCDQFLFSLDATVFEAGTWVSSKPIDVSPADYFYTGVPFDQADPPWSTSNRVTGEISLAGPLPPGLPETDIRYALGDFSFTDGVQTRTPANSTVCAFEVGTNENGQIVHWFLYLREVPFPGAGMTQRTLDSSSAPGILFDTVGEGPADNTVCGDIALTSAGISLAEGSWIRVFQPGRATFLVSKDFSDDNTAEVEVTLSCNTGLPLQQTTTISEGDPVNFVITDFEDGELNCEVTEVVPSGYSASYDNGADINESGCVYEGISTTIDPIRTCAITNSLEQVEVEVSKVWIDENPQVQGQNFAEADWMCSDASIDGGPETGDVSGQLQFFGNPGSDSFGVYPSWSSVTTCLITELSLFDGGVEMDSEDCQGLVVFPGSGAFCTLYNTRLYEGIPTLSRHGLLWLALLMLSVGLIAFRRLT